MDTTPVQETSLHQQLLSPTPPLIRPKMALNFPAKIYQILENESTDIIRWHSNGHAFRIVDHDRFEREIIPKYFRHNQLSSVQRQLNLYGFKCVSRGEDKGAFFHPHFRRGDWEVVKTITKFVANKKEEAAQNAAMMNAGTKSSVSMKSVANTFSGQPMMPNFPQTAFADNSDYFDVRVESEMWEHWHTRPAVVPISFEPVMKSTLQSSSFDRMLSDLNEVQAPAVVEPVVKAYPRQDVKQEALQHARSKTEDRDPNSRPFVFVINDSVTIDPDFDLVNEFALFHDMDLVPPPMILTPRQAAKTSSASTSTREIAVNTAPLLCENCGCTFGSK